MKCKPVGYHSTTFEFKQTFLCDLIHNSEVSNVEVYEDRVSHVKQFETLFHKWQLTKEFQREITFRVNKVDEVYTILPEEMELKLVGTLVEKYLPNFQIRSTVRYVGVDIDLESKVLLEKSFGSHIPQGWERKMTVVDVVFVCCERGLGCCIWEARRSC